MKRFIVKVNRTDGTSATWDMSEIEFETWKGGLIAAGFSDNVDPSNLTHGYLNALGQSEFEYAVKGTDGILDLQRSIDELLSI